MGWLAEQACAAHSAHFSISCLMLILSAFINFLYMPWLRFWNKFNNHLNFRCSAPFVRYTCSKNQMTSFNGWDCRSRTIFDILSMFCLYLGQGIIIKSNSIGTLINLPGVLDSSDNNFLHICQVTLRWNRNRYSSLLGHKCGVFLILFQILMCLIVWKLNDVNILERSQIH